MLNYRLQLWFTWLCCQVFIAAHGLADELLVDFHRDIQPLLAARCLACHGNHTAKGGVNLTTRAWALQAADSGRYPLVPRQPQASELLIRVHHSDPDLRMPAQGSPLSEQEMKLLEAWIAQGADWPEHWAYAPLMRPRVPEENVFRAWCATPIDRFVTQQWVRRGLSPAPPAERRQLVRRLYFDLLGLPPTPAQTQAFLADTRPDAYSRLVEQLLASPAYGERWSRHWMDQVHFAETHGHDQDRPREHAWPYRDYLIHAFNGDMPYNRFVTEQIAGDISNPQDPWGMIATGFLAAGPWDESSLRDIREDSLDREIARYEDRDDMVATTMSTFVSSSVHCARCHDHKFDPISQRDYYALQAVFAGIDKANRVFDTDPGVAAKRRELESALLLAKRELAESQDLWTDKRLHANSAEWEVEVRRQYQEWQAAGGKDPPPAGDSLWSLIQIPTQQRTPEQQWKVMSEYLQRTYQAQLNQLPAPREVYCGTPTFKADGSFRPAMMPRAVHVLSRGQLSAPQEQAVPGTLTCITSLPHQFGDLPESQRRQALAAWITHPENGLTWRSVANRIWQHHFGRPLADTPNDFGRMGSPPSHPELLDWLAVELRDHAGSWKHLHRMIVTSAVYQQSSESRRDAVAIDGDNRFLWRMNRRRLDAESFRDALLVLSESLNPRMGGPSEKHFRQSAGLHATPDVDYLAYDVTVPGSHRRSIYRFLFRTLPDPFFDTLDCPDASQLTPIRYESLTPLQNLVTLHHPFVLAQSRTLAGLVPADASGPSEAAEWLFRVLLMRAPSAGEQAAWSHYIAQHGLANAARFLINTNEFMFVE